MPSEQKVKICFFEYACWKCHAINHIYYAEPSSSQNVETEDEETLWNGESLTFQPEILAAVKNYRKSKNGKSLRVGEIKSRYSRTMECSYISFGCYKCDAIFGNFYVMEAKLEAKYEEDKLRCIEIKVTSQKRESHRSEK